MAEAHLAVAFSFTITHDGVDISYNREVLQLIWQSGWRTWKKRYARLMNNIKNGVFPASPASLLFLTAIITFLQFLSFDVSYGLMRSIHVWLPGERFAPFVALLLTCLIFSFLLWIGIIIFLRQSLKLLLSYQGWIYETRARNKMSFKTKIWAVAVKLLQGRNKPMLYSFQSSLPRLSVPSLDDTIRRYLASVRPLLKDDDFERREKLAQEFKQGIGRKLQWFLWLKSWWASNYISDWWEEYVYLRGRGSILVNSNYYGIDCVTLPTSNQAARAATFVYTAFLFRRSIERQTLKPLMIRNLIPLCSWQYERVFNTTREPGIETDKIVHRPDSQHIIVGYKGVFYKVPVYNRNRLLERHEIQALQLSSSVGWNAMRRAKVVETFLRRTSLLLQLDWILQDDYKPDYGEEHLGALTTADRVTWANARKDYFSKGINKISLDTIERAAFCVVLDDRPYEINEPYKGDLYVKNLLHGRGYNYWLDKSFTLIVGTNARMGLHLEHAYADGPILAQMWEFCLTTEMLSYNYSKEGRIVGILQGAPPTPIRLKWELGSKCLDLIKTCCLNAEKLIEDVDQRLYIHRDFGKGFIKTCSVSPDAYVQMALQLAYYRDSGKFGLTYESSMLRLFRDGRTETIRTVTTDSCAWARSMDDPAYTDRERLHLFKKACDTHQRHCLDAMCGKGVDRHLFCLYVVSKYLEVESPFLKEVLQEPWRLSTSQTPHQQMEMIDQKQYPNFIAGGGGFGPVADDGYGVAYMLCGEDTIFFHISSKISCQCTDSLRLLKTFRRTLLELKTMFETNKKQTMGCS